MKMRALVVISAAMWVAHPLRAQVVTGTVSDSTSGLRLTGVVMQLLDSQSVVVAHSLTNERGAYRLRAPRSGTHRIRTLRIGYLPVVSTPLFVEDNAERRLDLLVAGEPVRLVGVDISGRSPCRRYADGGLTATLWEQARTALLATQLGEGSGVVDATVVTFERRVDPERARVLSAAGQVTSGASQKIWSSLPADTLSRIGYVVPRRDGLTTYHAPDIDVLLSAAFIRDHCFRTVPGASADVVGLSFEPTPERDRVTGIRGILWIEREAATLRRLDFSYANVGPVLEQSGAGGTIEFTQLAGGAWSIASWALRLPVIEREDMALPTLNGRMTGMGDRFVVRELREVGGRLVVAAQAGDTLWTSVPLPLRGVVLDSSRGAPVAGALVELPGTGRTATTGPNGRFDLGAVAPGTLTLEVRTPQLMAANRYVQLDVVHSDSVAELAVRLPATATTRMSALRGTVVSDSAGMPIVAAEVSLPTLNRSVYSDGRGQFELRDVPAGTHRLVVRRLGYSRVDTAVTFVAGQFRPWVVQLPKTRVLETVEVTATRFIRSFEENRRLGIGTFFTRATLDSIEYQSVGTVLSQVPGANVVRGLGLAAWLAGARPGRQHSPLIPSADELRRGAKLGECYAHVYIDGVLISRGPPDPLFDLSTLNTQQIEAIEYYPSRATTPGAYSRPDANCGVLAIWLKIG